MQIIGFAKTYYTLWDYTQEPQYILDAYGKHHKVGVTHRYNYIKNVSTDIKKVRSLYPDIEIDTELRGTSSFFTSEKLDLPETYFWGGKYKGQLIEEIMEKDFDYCLWAVRNYNLPYIEKHPLYIAHMEAIEKAKQDKITDAGTLKSGDVVEITFNSNGYNANDDYTTCWTVAIYNDIKLNVECKGAHPVKGIYPYLMPIINGKAQRTKNKTIQVTVDTVYKTDVWLNDVVQTISIK